MLAHHRTSDTHTCRLRRALIGPLLPFQRIAAGGDGKKVKFFGQSIHGVMDLNGDGITDVTIGGLGGASLFW